MGILYLVVSAELLATLCGHQKRRKRSKVTKRSAIEQSRVWLQSEIVMLGTIAQRVPDRVLHWNAPALTFDEREATAFVRRQYREGWEIDALVS